MLSSFGFMYINTPIGNTLPVMVITAILSIFISKIKEGEKNV
ncbi:hypothetical protein [Clostridium sp.]|nr:hypothetical protein [Clostridium sp.]